VSIHPKGVTEFRAVIVIIKKKKKGLQKQQLLIIMEFTNHLGTGVKAEKMWKKEIKLSNKKLLKSKIILIHHSERGVKVVKVLMIKSKLLKS